MLQRSCTNCSQPFSMTEQDQAFYQKVSVPKPNFCPTCRSQRRLAWRNERNLYRRACDFCKKNIISMYSPDKPWKVYCPTCWWSDNWNQYTTAKKYNFNKTFFNQFQELMRETPVVGLLGSNNINSEYVNGETDDKNCYMNFGGHFNEDCYYNTYALESKNCADNYWIFKSELVYESINPQKCYNCTFLQNCSDCVNCHFSYDLRSCKNCIGCIGLRQKEYYLFNQPISKEQFEEIKENCKSFTYREELKKRCQEFFKTQPHKATEIEMSENSTGDFIRNSKNCAECYESEDNQDLKYVYISGYIKDSMDCNSVGWAELLYECMGIAAKGGMINTKFCTQGMDLPDCEYSWCNFNSQKLFGCIGLKKAQYCILNKQYSKEEYEQLVPQIIEHMKSTGEYGEFFPFHMSPFAYNESVAQEYHPLNQQQTKLMGSYWENDIGTRSGVSEATINWENIPDNIDQIDESITQQILSCKNTNKAFKITQQELKFYKTNGLPIPRLCPDERHKKRMQLRNPRYLWNRNCTQCQSPIQTSYSPERPEPIYCESCYLKEVK